MVLLMTKIQASSLNIFLGISSFDIGYEKRESLAHRTATTSYPCYGQVLGEFGGSWSCTTFPNTKVAIFSFIAKKTKK